MSIDIYWAGLLLLAPLVGTVARWNEIAAFVAKLRGRTTTGKTIAIGSHDVEARRFKSTFLWVYLLVMGAEWLQGPFTYTLFRHEKALTESTVALFYIITYTGAALSSLFTGYLTDRFGRRRACLCFCFIHALAAVTVYSDQLSILALGRVLAGIGITLLWTAFESWMIAEYNERGLEESELTLGAMFAGMTTANCLTAIFAGILGHCVVFVMGSKVVPFLFGIVLDLIAAILMVQTWSENRGTPPSSAPDEEGLKQEPFASSLFGGRAYGFTKDARVWSISFATCCFEGTLFLFLFFWPGALQDAHGVSSEDDTIPHGVIFACFMASMVLGALGFNILISHHPPSSSNALENPIKPHTSTPTRLLGTALLLAAVGFLIAAFIEHELSSFFAFLLIEACNGVYVPSIAYHRGIIVEDKDRARVYSLMNIPLFVFVVLALSSTVDSDGGGHGAHRKTVFVFCATILLAATVVVFLLINLGQVSQGFHPVPSKDENKEIISVEMPLSMHEDMCVHEIAKGVRV
ncbi:MFS general substrate transporter [Xylariaceae sp. FL1019]|nr:MFS general substrate transporter [Xylariaceae sp. FL1019]